MDVLSRPYLRQYIFVITANLCVISLGMGIAWPSPVLVKLRNETETVLPRPITEEQGAWVVSIGFLVATFTNFIPALLVDRIGRKYCIILGGIPRFCGGMLFIFATEVWMLLVGRTMLGISDCFIVNVVPMYAAEIASKEVRGGLGSLMHIFVSLGILMMLSIGPLLSYTTLNLVFTCVTVVSIIPLFFLPDSPYFLYTKARTADSIKVLTYLRNSESKAGEEVKVYAETKVVKIDKLQLFRSRTFLKAVVIVMLLAAGNQLIGFQAISFYLQTILESTQTSVRDEVGSAIVGLIQLLASFCTASVSDRFGRKPIFITSLSGMTLGMIGLGAFFNVAESGNSVSGFINFLPLISIALFVFCYSSGSGALYFMLITELFDGPARSTGVSMSVNTMHAFTFIVTRYFPLLTTAIGPAATYWIFGGNCVLMMLFVIFCVPETKGKTFVEIQVALGAKEMNIAGESDRKMEINEHTTH